MLTGFDATRTDARSTKLPGEIALVGPFDPRSIAPMAPPEWRSKLEGLRAAPGVPLHSLAAGLLARGEKVGLIGGGRDLEPMEIRTEALDIALYRQGNTQTFCRDGRRRNRDVILDTLMRWRPAIVHAHWTQEHGRAVADWRGPKVLTVHDAAWEYARLGFSAAPAALAYTARWLLNTRETLAGFTHVIAVSPFVEEYLRSRHRFRGEIRVIPNSVPPLPADIVPATSFPKTGRITFATYGGPGKLKNVAAAVRAFQQLPLHLQARLLIFGAGWTTIPGDWRTPQIEFRGALAHADFLSALATEVDVWVHPSLIEAHPLVVCEALQCGCPVIAGRDSGGTAWTLGSGGLLIDVTDHRAIAEAMLHLAHQRAEGMALVERGRARIADCFSPDRVLNEHEEFYRDVVEDAGKGGASR